MFAVPGRMAVAQLGCYSPNKRVHGVKTDSDPLTTVSTTVFSESLSIFSPCSLFLRNQAVHSQSIFGMNSEISKISVLIQRKTKKRRKKTKEEKKDLSKYKRSREKRRVFLALV